MIRQGPSLAAREFDVAAALLVARSRVLVVTSFTLAAALAFDEAAHPALQYTLAFAGLPLSVALALSADRLRPTACGAVGAGIDALILAVALVTFPESVATVAAAFLVPVLIASYTGGRSLGLATGGVGLAIVAVVAATGGTSLSPEVGLLMAIAMVVSIAVVSRADALLARSTQRARYHEARASILFEHLAEPVVVTNALGRVSQCNGAARDLLGTEPAGVECADALGLRIGSTRVDCTGGCGLLAIAGSRDSGGIEATTCPSGRDPIPVLVSVVEVPGSDGSEIEYLHTLRNITKLKMADEAKTLFLATVTHELKTPLTVIRGFLETIDRSDVDEQLRVEAIGVMRRRASELSAIIDRVLLASRIDSGGLHLEIAVVDVVPIARDRVNALAGATGRVIALRAEALTPALLGEEAALATILDHLIDNACKYSPVEAKVEVAVDFDDHDVRIAVCDEGDGMTAEQAKHCFDRFWQADPTLRRKVGGSGIGLYIVRSLVESLQGSITVITAPGRGSRFTIRLRRADAAADLPPGEANALAPERSIVREFMRQIGVDTKETIP